MYIYSPENNSFFPFGLKDDYEKSGIWPSDGVEVSDDIFLIYSGKPPAGKVRGPGNDNYPSWLNVAPIPDSEMMLIELTNLSKKYQEDISALNNSWVAAAVSDGINEDVKKNAVIQQINDRKAKYDADRAEVISKYSKGA
ncbi:hypothetical protein [Cedecea lapagei]|uniref:hypothetical protein n=1 Tax=Cedecea lapagei TaxID=158823 RepID=UPI0013DFBD4A|nr:hypothetical protein [Cedecea lapagei]